jgi:serine/threonine-protein kinase RsbW
LESSKCYKAIIPSELSAVGNTVKEVLKYLHTVCCDIDESILFDIKVILNELIINAIMHGNLQEPSKFVKVYAEVSEGDCVFITIEDEGEGYDYKCLQSKCIDSCSNETLCDLAEEGRGILIAKNLCDSLNQNEKGNTVFVTKKILKD